MEQPRHWRNVVASRTTAPIKSSLKNQSAFLACPASQPLAIPAEEQYLLLCMRMTEQCNVVVCIDDWQPDESLYEKGYYPEGTREKASYRSPGDINNTQVQLKPAWKYLFKKSRTRTPWQFWMEVVAYRIGQLVNVLVPPAFVGLSNKENPDCPVYGALIEWFYGEEENYIEGARLIGPLIPNFDYKKGKPHSLETIFQISLLKSAEKNRKSLIQYWASTLAFDTIIGNTDRHPENWGLITPQNDSSGFVTARLSPAFDNGTAMSYEQPEDHFERFNDNKYLVRYLTRPQKARHHMQWSVEEPDNLNFFEFMRKYVDAFPETRQQVLSVASLDASAAWEILEPLISMPVEEHSCLTRRRLEFTLDLIVKRCELLRDTLEKA